MLRKFRRKTKIVFFQACQEKNEANPITWKDCPKSLVNICTLPNMSDFVYCFSAHRDPDEGSPYIQTLEEVFKEYAGQKDILHMLARVNHKLTKDDAGDNYYNTGSFTSQLRKDLYFFPAKL